MGLSVWLINKEAKDCIPNLFFFFMFLSKKKDDMSRADH